MTMPTTRHLLAVTATLLLGACAASTSLVVERLDPRTGVTVLSATEPLVLYRDNSAYAAYARNFVYLGPVEVNNMGARSYYLWFGIWGTMRDDLRLSNQRDGFESVVLFVDGEPMSLELHGWTLDSIGVSAPVYVKPVAGAADAYYRVTIDQVRLIANARDVEIRVGDGRGSRYSPWDEQAQPKASLRAFVRNAYD